MINIFLSIATGALEFHYQSIPQHSAAYYPLPFPTPNCTVGLPTDFTSDKNLVTFCNLALMLDCSGIYDHFVAFQLVKYLFSSSESRSLFCIFLSHLALSHCHNFSLHDPSHYQ